MNRHVLSRPRCPAHRRRLPLALLPALMAAVAAGCRVEDVERGRAAGDRAPTRTAPPVDAEAVAALAGTLERAESLADSVEDVLRPVPLLRPAEEAALRGYTNAENLRRARSLGVRAADSAELEALVAEGRLVRLEDSTSYWVVRDLDDSRPYVTPDTRALLERLGRAFQGRLDSMGIPRYRIEVSSVLRTAEDQASLRTRNVNAAAGASAHEFGTTVDLAYSGYAAPADLPPPLVGDAPDPLRPHLEAVARRVLERVAARKSRELEAVLGRVLREAQEEGRVLVTLERLQPVYHITVGRPTD